jgi:hypothetical protein
MDILIILGEEHKSQSFSLCSFLHSPVTSSLLDQISPSAPCSQTHSVYTREGQWLLWCLVCFTGSE